MSNTATEGCIDYIMPWISSYVCRKGA